MLTTLFESPSQWCKGALARDIRGGPVSFISDDAVSWCLEGRLCCVIQDPNVLWNTRRRVLRAITNLFPLHASKYLYDFNDSLLVKYADVLKVLEYAEKYVYIDELGDVRVHS